MIKLKELLLERREKFSIVYHGTDRMAANDIKRKGVSIDKSTGGYFGWGFYTTPDKNLAKSNYADFTGEDEDDATVLKFRIFPKANILDLRDEKDWETYRNLNVNLNDRNLYKKMISDGIDGLWDNSFGGVVIYNPKALKLIGEV